MYGLFNIMISKSKERPSRNYESIDPNEHSAFTSRMVRESETQRGI